ncbi:AAA family ATPase [Patescibacteria group bacterium]|nr:AAA family ATPase [Patescibacteria group bacterium]
MNKIVIIGCPGAGKTTLARRLGAQLDIPVHHLDQYFWKENRISISQEDFLKIQKDLMAEKRWIIDGNFTKSIENRVINSDTVIFLDFSKTIILWRIFKRYIQYFGKVRPDVGGNNKEKIEWKNIKFILKYPAKDIHDVLARYTDKDIFILHNPKEVADFLKKAAPIQVR